MSWDDIDFDLIITGMITRGPAAVLFSDYLNTFTDAGNERVNLLATNLVVDFDPFQSGEIRNSIFWGKYNKLIDLYRDLWQDFDFYKQGVLLDLTNSDNYKYVDQDLIDIITQEAFDAIMFNSSTRWTAAVLNGLYEIYKITALTLRPIIATKSSTRVNNNIYMARSNRKGKLGGGGANTPQEVGGCPEEPWPQYDESNNIAYPQYLNDSNPSYPFIKNGLFWEAKMGERYFVAHDFYVTSFASSGPDQWNISTTYRSGDDMFIEQFHKKHSNDMPIDLDIFPTVNIRVNQQARFSSISSGNVGPIDYDAAYDAAIPKIEVIPLQFQQDFGASYPPSDNDIVIDNYFINTVPVTEGFRKLYQYSDVMAKRNVTELWESCDVDEHREQQHTLGLTLNDDTIIDLNNIGLDFFIAPTT